MTCTLHIAGASSDQPANNMLNGQRSRHSAEQTTELLSTNVSLVRDNLVGLVVKASASRAIDPGSDSRLHRGDFSWSSLPMS